MAGSSQALTTQWFRLLSMQHNRLVKSGVQQLPKCVTLDESLYPLADVHQPVTSGVLLERAACEHLGAWCCCCSGKIAGYPNSTMKGGYHRAQVWLLQHPTPVTMSERWRDLSSFIRWHTARVCMYRSLLRGCTQQDQPVRLSSHSTSNNERR